MIHLCAACGGPRSSNQWLCSRPSDLDNPGCEELLESRLRAMPELWADLETTLTRQDVIGGDGGRKSSESAMVFKSSADEAKTLLRETVTAWVAVYADKVAEALPTGAATHVLVGARWLHAHLPMILKGTDSVELADELGHAVEIAQRATDRPAVMLGLGKCESEGCERFMYVLQEDRGTAQFQCRCGALYELPELLKGLASKAEEKLVSSKVAREWVLMLLGKRISQSTFATWCARDKIKQADWTEAGEKAYRFGDVRDQALVWVTKGKAAA